jgi:dihydroneopterin aldolase
MSQQLIISLKGVRFWAFHGVFPEERVLGNWFTVNLAVEFTASQPILELENTIDYGTLHQWLKEEMEIPTPLLEEIGERMVEKCKNRIPSLKKVQFEIQKQQPAIGLLSGNSSISIVFEAQ